MNKVFLSSMVLGMILLMAGSISAQTARSCNLQVSLLNQDPYPAVPGDYVKLVFQVTGTDNPACGAVDFKLLQDYPFSLDPNTPASVNLAAGGYLTDFGTFFLIPFKIKVDGSAIDSQYPLKVSYSRPDSDQGEIVSNFTIAVNQTSTDFDVAVDYASSTSTLTFDILNIGKNDAEALTIQVPQQAGLNFTDGNKKIIGKLNKGDDTTVSFTAVPTGTNIQINLYYNDAIGVRREVDKTISFSSSNFQTQAKSSGLSSSIYLIAIILVLIIAFFIYSRYKKNKRAMLKK